MFLAFLTAILTLTIYTIIQIFISGEKTNSRKYLLIIIITLGLSQIPPYLMDVLTESWGRLIDKFPTRHWVFLLGPSIYLYSKSFIREGSVKRESLHLTPLILWWMLFVFIPEKLIHSRVMVHLYGFTCVISLLTYGLLIIKTLVKHTIQLRSNYSYSDIFLEIRWLSYIASTLVIITVLIVITVTLSPNIFPPETTPVKFLKGDPELLDIIHSISVLIFLFIFSLFAQKQEKQKKLEYLVPPADSMNNSESDNSSEYQRLLIFMNDSRIYLNNTLSLQELAEKFEMGRNELSRIINSESGCNFFHFINGYRARYFAEVIKLSIYPNYNLLGIAMECGFNSKATFCSAIKREFNKTPSQLAKEIRSTL